MNYVLGILAGFLWGGLAALLNCRISLGAVRRGTDKAMMGANLTRVVIDIAALALPLLIRKSLPVRVELVLVGTAAALGIVMIVFAFKLAAGKIK